LWKGNELSGNIKGRKHLVQAKNFGGDPNENLKSAIKIQNTARLSCKLTIMILMV
jgi:hypothetical protein